MDAQEQSEEQEPRRERGTEREGAPRQAARPAVLAGVLIVALGVAAAVVLTGHTGGDSDDGPAGGLSGLRAQGAPPFRAGDARTVVLDGVSGSVQVTADPGADAVSGSFHRQDGTSAPLQGTVSTDGDGSGPGGRTLTVRCLDDDGPGPCAGTLQLTVPEHTALRMRQTSGSTVIDGLGGDLDVDAASLQLTTRDLRSPHADVNVVSGSADLGFADAPADLDLHASSASVAVRLPQVDGGYAVTTAAASANVQVGVPRDPGAGHRVALTVTSGSLSVQNA